MARGTFITLEGIEGAGKSTVSRFVCAALTARGHRVLATREPGGTPLAERIRSIALERGAEPISPVSETLLMFAARALHLDHVIRPALARGEWVVCDRFTDATRAYQGAARGVDLQLIEALARAVQGATAPDCTLLLDLPVGVGLARATARSGVASDRFEAETVSFHEKVRAGYLALARMEPGRIRIIDAAVAPPQVEAQVAAVLATLTPGTGGL
jgi:dTMP kinase